jgi:ABC-type sugar transport system ATPase subunit
MADLELNHISKSFNGHYALQDVTFSCKRGEIHALLGENGAGKSTLLKVLSGAYQPDSGEIKIFGQVAQIRNPADAMKYGIGCVYQELSFIPDLTVAENIFIGRIPRNRFGAFDHKALHRMCRDLLDKYGASEIDPDMIAGRLPLSQKQIIEILKVLSKDPQIVILDEATSALSEDRVKWLLQLARRLANENKIVIFISHRMSEIQDGCDTISILRNGSYAGDLRVDEHLNMDDVIAMMLGRKMSGYFPEITNHASSQPVLEVHDLHYNRALNGIDLTLFQGEVLGVGGLAGQGQAELLLSLFGVYQAKGDVRVEGRPFSGRTPRTALQRGIALVPEERGTQGLFLSKSIAFNIAIPSVDHLRQGLFISRGKESAIVRKYVEALAVKASNTDMPVQELSGGNQQKVVMAKIMSCSPRLLLLHDITRGVDVGTKKEMFGLIRDFASKGGSVIFFSTDVEELVHVCDRTVVLYDGRIGADLKGSALTKENIIGASIGAQTRA